MKDIENNNDSPPPAIELFGVSQWFRERKALNKISLRVEQGSIHGFVGANGAGKTTTLKIIATLLTPGTGEVSVYGRTLEYNQQWAQQRTGYMPDDSGLYETLRVEEYLDFFGAAYGIPRQKRDELIDGVLQLTDMTSRRADMIKGLSRGMRQRVALARVLIHDPKLLLLDEPASGLDPRARIELMEILRELRRMGKTIFISSHILSELAELCDAVTLIDRGKIRYSGSMQTLLSREQETRAYLVRLGGDDTATRENAHEQLEALEYVAGVEGTGAEAEYRVQVAEGGPVAHEFLKDLMAHDVPVAAFHEDRRGLDQAFLDLTEPGIDG